MKRQHLPTWMLTLCCVYAMTAPSYAEDWQQFGGAQRNFQVSRRFPSDFAVAREWQKTLGQGMSGVVVDGQEVFAHYLAPWTESEKQKPNHLRQHQEVVAAMDEGGNVRWEYRYDAGHIEEQQAFGGRARAPQATPTVTDDIVYTIGFTGKLHALARTTGKRVWSVDLVERCQATPVQFGFSASPVVMEDRLFVLAGGADGGLLCLDRQTGKTLWNVPCEEASYATPVLWTCHGEQQVIFMTRKTIQGVSQADGAVRWTYQLPKTGLTNVPTPLAVDDRSLIVSGQGINGTRRLQVTQTFDGVEVTEAWHNPGLQFFYCNWTIKDGILFGCEGKLLVAVDVASGKRLGRWRGFADGNLVMVDDGVAVLDGNGWLNFLSIQGRVLQHHHKVRVLDARCWTAPTLVGNRLYCRGDDQFTCVALVDPETAETDVDTLPSTRITQAQLVWSEQEEADSIPPLQQILKAYEQNADQAWDVYQQLRREKKLTRVDREELMDLARGEGLASFADQIEQHLAEDFAPKVAKGNPPPNDAVETPVEKKSHRGDNGLLYVEFGIRNRSLKTVHAVVQGPGKHPFSYGLPLRPGKLRKETWPVGTKLYRSNNEIRQDILFEVKASDAGKILEVK